MKIDAHMPLKAYTEAMSNKSAGTDNSGFSRVLKAYTQQVNAEHKKANAAAEALAMGESRNTSETLLAIQKADLSFQLMLSVRNKLVEAYHEVMRMQV